MTLARSNLNGGASSAAIRVAVERDRPSPAVVDGNLLYAPRQAIERMGGIVSEATLSAWRMTGAGPRFVKLGRRVAYREADIARWLDERSVTTTAEAEAKGF